MKNKGLRGVTNPETIKLIKHCLYLTYMGKQTSFVKFQLITLLMMIVVGFSGCQRQYPVNIPYVTFDYTINIFDPAFVNLQGVGGSVYIEGGSRGILIYRVSIEQFNAYERHCTHDTENPCGKVSFDNSGIILVDDDCSGSGCGSKFNVIDGSVINGPAQYPLIQYNTSFDGIAMLRVFNN
jgi:hypothetical protein